ncbi:Pectin lyase fold/virulence factor [Pseudocohnilembus persalinus]|uniref:Pectin lyase fold/virulence factor n=1 Tax=Pseudocohnilembus persalinus TaxID=266149 RepID=A0A0V0Q7C4_PSEPJ|nr:Pectin lyase fold/virulence factor [Pseudocohnilembus persalinus]|eukprot:KRW98081.1 Pectin lyase fold/virulence factor [Pseudocohnilembus persalinus]
MVVVKTGLLQGQLVTIRQSNFTENYLEQAVNSNGGALFMQKINFVLIENSQFMDHKCIQFGGAVYSYQVNQVELNENLFYNNTAGKGGGVYVQNSNISILKNSNFTLNIASSDGGGFYTNAASNILQSDIDINGNYFAHNTGQRGSSLYINYYQKCTECIVQYNYFYDNYCTGLGGGGLFIQNSQEFLVQYNQYVDNDCYDSVLYIYGGGCLIRKSSHIYVRNEQYKGNKATNSGGLAFLQMEQSSIQNVTIIDGYAHNSGAISVYYSSYINVNSIRVENAHAYIIGVNVLTDTKKGSLNINNSQYVVVKNCNIKDSQAIDRSALSFEQSKNVTVSDCVIQNNTANSYGSGIAFISSYNITLNNVTCFQNHAQFGAGIFFEGVSYIQMNNVINQQNLAQNWGAGLYMEFIDNSVLQNITLINNICQNKAGGGFYLSSFNNVQIINITSQSNQAQLGAGGYLFDIQNTVIQQLLFEDNQSEHSGAGIIFDQLYNVSINNVKVRNNWSNYQIAGIMITDSMYLNLQNIQIVNNTAQNIGGLYMVYNNEQIYIKDSQILKNQALYQSSGVQMYYNLQVYFDNTTFLENYNDLYVNTITVDEQELLSFNNCVFCQYKDDILYQNYPDVGGLIYATDIQDFYFTSSFIQNSMAQQNGGGAYLYKVDNIYINDSTFNNLKVIQQEIQNEQYGGGIYINTAEYLEINNSTFKNCYSYLKGGALYLYQVTTTKINDSLFEDNKSKFIENMSIYEKNDWYTISQGGSIYYEKQYKKNYNVLFSIYLTNLEFRNSSASSGGGALINFPPDSNFLIEINNILVENCKADIGYAFRFLGSYEKQFEQTLKEQIIDVNNNQGYILKNKPFFINYADNEYQIDSKTSQFQVCESNRYLIQGKQSKCEKCPENGVCNGGYVPIFPKSTGKKI